MYDFLGYISAEPTKDFTPLALMVQDVVSLGKGLVDLAKAVEGA
jgi:hypothetical protein